MSEGEQAKKCFFCGISTVSRARRNGPMVRTYQLTERYLTTRPHILAYAKHMFDIFHISDDDKACRPCTQRAERFYKKQQTEEARRDVAVEYVSSLLSVEISDHPVDPLMSPQQTSAEHETENEEYSPALHIVQAKPKTQRLNIDGFRRLSSTSTYCIVAGCSKKDLHRINNVLRTYILSLKSIYVPGEARVCSEHQEGEVWQNIEEYSRPMHNNFNSEQIRDMLILLQKKVLSFSKSVNR
ncbi:uncharacterized protein LOC113513174 [Galleria mellonella]|uniref:Uncharacterized protein LOC113513174 n=1 Tax=Galleria mellonella TaxID=7137 RepID=A0A6J1WGZ4_GALME|nr:uncharacterized protein LOC113513174 [Galleria mellonella]